MKRAIAVLAAAALAAGCIEAEERPATWAYVHAAIVTPSCATATCHGDLGERAALRLQDPDEAYAALRDGRWVLAGDATSPLLYLLEGEERVRMPPDAPLPAADIELIRTWITDGAAP